MYKNNINNNSSDTGGGWGSSMTYKHTIKGKVDEQQDIFYLVAAMYGVCVCVCVSVFVG
jgi:hypothetical protein